MIKNDGGMAESVLHYWPLNLKAVTFSSFGDLSDCVNSVAVGAFFVREICFVSLLAFWYLKRVIYSTFGFVCMRC